MYESYFGFTEAPFSIAPNPRYLYMSPHHKEAMAHLLFGVREGGGFVQLTGEVGTGKTTLCRQLLAELPEEVDVALILNPRIDERELLKAICNELRVDYERGATIKQLLDRLNTYLLDAHSRGRNTVLIIDEAQNLSEGVLEQVRLLTNLETSQKKLLQIILVGQTELRDMLALRSLRQISQRITARYHLKPLDRRDLREYLAHRLKQSGCERMLFSRGAVSHIYRLSGGIPRLVNVICDRALLGAYAQGLPRVTRGIVNRAGNEVFDIGKPALRRWLLPTALVLTLLALPIAAWRLGWLPPELQQRFDQLAPEWLQQWPAGWFPLSLASGLVMNAHAQNSAVLNMRPATGLEERQSTMRTPPKSAYLLSQIPFKTAETLLQELTSLPENQRDRVNGLRRLTHRWNLRANIVFDCITVRELGLDCYQLEQGFRQILRLDRPALVEVVAEDESRGHVLITEVHDDVMVLEMNHQVFRMRLLELEKIWNQRALVFWKPPPLEGGAIGEDSPPEDIMWLRRALNLVSLNYGGDPIEPLELPEFDTALMDKLNAFQQRNGLAAAESAGVETLIMLNTRLDYESFPTINR